MSILAWLIAITSFSQTEATTFDGKKVILYPDGTWKAVSQESTQTIHPLSIAHLELPKTRAQDRS